MEVIEHYLYTKDHEWVHVEESSATIGITDYAQGALGDITYIELPETGAEVEQFEQCASVESVKAASDIFSPLSGKVIEVNSDLEANPGLINKDCYGKGWLVKIELTDIDEKAKLMTAAEYTSYLETLE